MKLIWLIGAGLLLAGTVEAGEPDISDGTDWAISSIASSVLVDEVLLKKLIMEAEQYGGSLHVTPVYYNEKTKEYTKVNYSCYQRMREAMRMVNEGMYLSVPRDGKPTQWVLPIPKGKADSWDAVIKDCVQ